MTTEVQKPFGARTQKSAGRRICGAARAVMLCGLLIWIAALFGCSSGTVGGEGQSASGTVALAAGEALTIDLKELTTSARFYSVEVDGTTMEVIALLDSSGEVRTAFNTCQVCYGSSRAYYVQSGDYLVCQNCGNRFSMDQVGIQSGGCNPWPILESDRTLTDDTLSISYETLAAAKALFATWKTDY